VRAAVLHGRQCPLLELGRVSLAAAALLATALVAPVTPRLDDGIEGPLGHGAAGTSSHGAAAARRYGGCLIDVAVGRRAGAIHHGVAARHGVGGLLGHDGADGGHRGHGGGTGDLGCGLDLSLDLRLRLDHLGLLADRHEDGVGGSGHLSSYGHLGHGGGGGELLLLELLLVELLLQKQDLLLHLEVLVLEHQLVVGGESNGHFEDFNRFGCIMCKRRY